MPVPSRHLWINFALLILLSCLLILSSYQNIYTFFRIPKSVVIISHSSSSVVSKMEIGATHEQNDADAWNNAKAVASAKQLMQTALDYQNQQTMGWGADDPEPSPGVYDWQSLDARVQLMRDTKAKMVLTLCCAPGWMRPKGYQDDWKDLETAPSQNHVQDFAHLAALITQRYPDVKYFLVWNELKGMWSTSPGATSGIANLNRWDYERYTTLYNAVYDAIKSVRPDALLGGPYVVMDSYGNRSAMSNPGPNYAWGTLDQRPLDVIKYWLQFKHGADFIAIDGTSANRDGVWLENEFATAQKFVDVYNWIHSQPNGGTTLPIWWAEWYAGYPSNAPKSTQYYNALMASSAIYTLGSGATALLVWKPQGDASGFSFPEGLWNDTNNPKGGQPTAYYFTSKAIKDYFSTGTSLYTTKSSTSNVTVLASTNKTMIVNCLSVQQQVTINGTTIMLSPYQVMVY